MTLIQMKREKEVCHCVFLLEDNYAYKFVAHSKKRQKSVVERATRTHIGYGPRGSLRTNVIIMDFQFCFSTWFVVSEEGSVILLSTCMVL